MIGRVISKDNKSARILFDGKTNGLMFHADEYEIINNRLADSEWIYSENDDTEANV